MNICAASRSRTGSPRSGWGARPRKIRAMLVCCMTIAAKSSERVSSRLASARGSDGVLLMGLLLLLAADFRHEEMDQTLEPPLQVHRFEDGLAFLGDRQERAGNQVGQLFGVVE